MNNNNNINESYTKFYSEKTHIKVYPTEFVVRTFLANYPGLFFNKPSFGSRILDIGFGDGRNTLFLCEQGFDVYGIEITEAIVEQTQERLHANNVTRIPELRVGRNNSIPYSDGFFNYILACHCCYYLDDGDNIQDNLKEYHRVLSTDGYLIASVLHQDSYILQDAKPLADGSMIVTNDPYKNRNGYRLHGFADESSIINVFSEYFGSFSFGQAHNNYYGIDENVFWVVCRKRND